MHFVNVKFCILIKISLKFISKVLIDKNPVLVKYNGLGPIRPQAIILTNADPVHCCVYVALGGRWVILRELIPGDV